MKKKLLAVAVSLVLTGPWALVAGQGDMGSQQNMGPEMMQPGGAGMGPQMMQPGGGGMAQMPMMQQMQAMQQQMARIHQSDDPAERRKLLEGHMNSMQGTPGQFERRMEMMQQRMDTTQMLMDQMMQNQQQMLQSMPGM